MTSLADIEAAADALPQDQQRILLEWLATRVCVQGEKSASSHSILEIAPVSVGKILQLPDSDDDLLGEMLEDRR